MNDQPKGQGFIILALSVAIFIFLYLVGSVSAPPPPPPIEIPEEHQKAFPQEQKRQPIEIRSLHPVKATNNYGY